MKIKNSGIDYYGYKSNDVLLVGCSSYLWGKRGRIREGEHIEIIVVKESNEGLWNRTHFHMNPDFHIYMDVSHYVKNNLIE